MLTANLYHIKRSNGLFYYAMDYLREIEGAVRTVIVRPEMAPHVRTAAPSLPLSPLTLSRAVLEVYKSSCRGDLIFTPTPHPYPFLSRQVIVFHDPYPFLEKWGSLKRRLLTASLMLSRCSVGFINRSEGYAFLRDIHVSEDRLKFLPNKFPALIKPKEQRSPRKGQLRVGLVGTDSKKKNYETLLDAVIRKGCESDVSFQVLGHPTRYFNDLARKYPECELHLVESSSCDMEHFIRGIDALVSVASHEGFGRPLASAALMGVPCLLLRQPVFQEFFGNIALFFSDADALVEQLHRITAGHEDLQTKPASPPRELVEAFHAGAAFLRGGGLR